MSTRVHVYTTSQLCARLHKISLDQSHAKWIFAISMLTVGLNTYLASRCNLCVLRRLLIHRKKKSTSYIKRIVILFFLQKSINSIIHEDIQDWKELHASINITSKNLLWNQSFWNWYYFSNYTPVDELSFPLEISLR